MTLKVWVHVDSGDGEPQRVCWYMGTSDLMIESAVRMQLHLPRYTRFLLRDADGDLVPVSSTLPHNQTYQLVTIDDDAASSARDVAPSSMHGSEGITSYQMMQDDVQPPRHKRRRRLAAQDSAANTVTDEPVTTLSDAMDIHDQCIHAYDSNGDAPNEALYLSASATRPRSIVYLVTRFLETFTCAIPNDDNVNFIPSTGPYALYALYCHLFQDAAYHPKSQNAFYKMTSTQGKVDRQRVIRYYQHLASRSSDTTNGKDPYSEGISRTHDQELEYAVYKPEGKGLLLRKYVPVDTEAATTELVRASGFVHVLDLDPLTVVNQYMQFIRGFVPISKAAFQAQAKSSSDQQLHVNGGD